MLALAALLLVIVLAAVVEWVISAWMWRERHPGGPDPPQGEALTLRQSTPG